VWTFSLPGSLVNFVLTFCDLFYLAMFAGHVVTKLSSGEFLDAIVAELADIRQVGQVLVLLLGVASAKLLAVDMGERKQSKGCFGLKILLACFEDPKILRADML
jgi:hypothetical protein